MHESTLWIYHHLICFLDVSHVQDKDYAQRYIDPKTAPAHIAVRVGTPSATALSLDCYLSVMLSFGTVAVTNRMKM